MSDFDNIDQKAPIDDNTSWYVIEGAGGSDRHSGYFNSEQNPYFDDMVRGENNKDIDAAYERAVEWEADWANLQEQRAYDREVLEEQRWYDSPLQKLKRDKAAGINSDIPGGSGSAGSSGGSSAQLAQREIDDQQAQSHFKNAYEDNQERMMRWQTASNFIGSVASCFSSIVGGISQLRMLPSQLRLADAQAQNLTSGAGLMSAQANEINSLLEGKKEYQSLLNAFQGVTNSSAILDSLMNLGNVLTPDSDIAPILNAMGVDPSKHEGISSAFKEMQKNPSVIARYHANKVASKRSQAEDSIYTQEYFTEVFDLTSKLNKMSLDLETLRTSISKNINTILSESSFVEDTAESMAVGASNQRTSMEYAQVQLEHDIKAYAGFISNIASRLNSSRSRVSELQSKGEDKLNRRERIEYDFLTQVAIPTLNATGPNETEQFNNIVSQIQRNKYLSNNRRMNLNGQDEALQDLSIYWGTVVNGTKSIHDIAHDWISSVFHLLGVGATVYAGYKVGTKPQQSGQVITDSAPGYDGQMRTTNQRTIQNVY